MAGVAAAVPDPGTCRLGPGLRGDAGILVAVARGLSPSELVFILGRLAASSDPKAARTFTSFVNVLFSANACPVPYQARDDRPGAAPGAIFSRATFLLSVVSSALGVREIDPARHRSAVVSCVRDPACFPDDVVRSALSPLTSSRAPPATLYSALTLAAQGRQEAGRRLVAALLDDLRRASPWTPRDAAKAGDKEPGAKRVKTEAGASEATGAGDEGSEDETSSDLENHWRGFVGVAKACVPLSLPVVARLPSARVAILVADESCALLVGRLKEWASNARVRRAYGVTVEVLEALGVEDTSDAPSESASGALSSAVALPQAAAAHRPGLPGVFGLPGMMHGPGTAAAPGAMGLAQMGRRPPMPGMAGQVGFNPGMGLGLQPGLGMQRPGGIPAALMMRQRQLMMAGGRQGPWMGGAPTMGGRALPGTGMGRAGTSRGLGPQHGAQGAAGAAGAGASRSLAEGGAAGRSGAPKRPRDS
ncbi:hypothetical protein FNF28_07062 [Cafeteria roenbergensis]|nr:hypothetical protein FNF28_07062 [Cafeteria roenbergensis]